MTKHLAVQSEQAFCAKPKPQQPFQREPAISHSSPTSEVDLIDIDVHMCSFQLQGLLKLSIIAKICIHFPAQSSYASMPLVQTKTQRLQHHTSTTPSTCPRSLSPARQHCSTSSWPPLYSVAHRWFWNLHELSSEESNFCQFLQPPSCGLWARSCWLSTSGSTRAPWLVD